MGWLCLWNSAFRRNFTLSKAQERMFDKISNDEVGNAIDELIAMLGVKEEMAFHPLIKLLKKGNAEGCVQEIANRMALPVCISLSYVSKDYSPGDTNRFHTTDLAQTNSYGRGVEGITAQVFVPEHLPIYGASSLVGYPIRVCVSENCCAYPYTFTSVMAHELSHVLLGSLVYAKEERIAHGYCSYCAWLPKRSGPRGRKIVKSRTSGNTMTTQVTTYGYLTDSQFQFACNRVAGLLNVHMRTQKPSVATCEAGPEKIEGGGAISCHVSRLFRTFGRTPSRENARGAREAGRSTSSDGLQHRVEGPACDAHKEC